MDYFIRIIGIEILINVSDVIVIIFFSYEKYSTYNSNRNTDIYFKANKVKFIICVIRYKDLCYFCAN